MLYNGCLNSDFCGVFYFAGQGMVASWAVVGP